MTLSTVTDIKSSYVGSNESLATSMNSPINTKVNYFSPNMECWNGAYYIHASLSIISSTCLIVFCFFVKMAFYETQTTTENYFAKSNSKSEILTFISKIFLILIFSFFQNSDDQWFLICGLIFFGAFMFFSYYYNRPFYNVKMMKVRHFL